jgi:cell division septation protein DedD
MIGGNGTRDFALEDGPRKDAELTLGPWLLAGLACALFVVCAVCFSAGYMLGRHNASQQGVDKNSATNTPLASAPAAGTNISAKPEARGNAAAPAPAAVSEEAEDEEAGAGAATPAPTAAPGVHPALPAESAPAAAPAHAQPVNGWMVQIAAVAHQEDADVLASALRRRGYAVVERRVTGDGLIHVQVGPFVNRSDANAMAQRLLGDGYNAAVQ